MQMAGPEMIQLAQIAAQDPKNAAAILAKSGVTPGMVHPMGTPGLGELMTQKLDAGASANTAIRGNRETVPLGAPANPEKPDLMTAPTTAEMTGTPDAQQLMAMALGGGGTPATPGGATADDRIKSLLGGLKGLSGQSSDQRPIMPSNAPAPGRAGGMSANSQMATLKMLTDMMQRGASVPTLGALLGRR